MTKSAKTKYKTRYNALLMCLTVNGMPWLLVRGGTGEGIEMFIGTCNDMYLHDHEIELL